MQSKNKIQTRPIEDFIGQVRTAKIIEAYKSVQQTQNVNVEMDGGNFKSEK
jgi:hypothetical protein